MPLNKISVWFACKLCKSHFKQVKDFIEHKKGSHFNEFQGTTCIIFEESSQSETGSEDEYGYEVEPVVVKEEVPDSVVIPPPNVEPPLHSNLRGPKSKPGPARFRRTQAQTKNSYSDQDDDSITHSYNARSSEASNSGFSDIDIDSIKNTATDRPCSSESELNLNPVTELCIFKSEAPSTTVYRDAHINKSTAYTKLTTADRESKKTGTQNPVVRIKRLTRKQVQISSFSSKQPPELEYHQSNQQQKQQSSSQPKMKSAAEQACQGQGGFPSSSSSGHFRFRPDPSLHPVYSKRLKNENVFCAECSKKFSNHKSYYHHHLTFHASHEEREKVFKLECPVCGKKFHQKSDLRKHSESHKSQEERTGRYQCHLCHFFFIHPSRLADHIRLHSGDRPFPCPEPECAKAFRYKHNLTEHLATHSEEKPFKCSQPNCDKAFRLAKSLKLHNKKAHTLVVGLEAPHTNPPLSGTHNQSMGLGNGNGNASCPDTAAAPASAVSTYFNPLEAPPSFGNSSFLTLL